MRRKHICIDFSDRWCYNYNVVKMFQVIPADKEKHGEAFFAERLRVFPFYPKAVFLCFGRTIDLNVLTKYAD